MAKSKLLKNSSFSVLQMIITAIVALILFKLMVSELGLEITGLWSYLSSLTAITAFGSFGFSNSLLYYIPKYTASKRQDQISSLVNTTFYSIFGLTSLLCLLAYLIFHFTIPFTINASIVPLANKLLPVVLASFFFSGLSSTFLSVLDGMILMHIRAKINIAGTIIFLIAGFVLIRQFGIMGVPLAQLCQNVFLLLAGFFYVKKHQPHYHFSLRFSRSTFREIFKYGFNFQLISVTQILAEPYIKSMLTKYAGTANVAIFDICQKIFGAGRGLIISANQTIVPHITVFKTLDHHTRLITFYKTNFRVILLLGAILFLAPLAFFNTLNLALFHSTGFNYTFILFNISIALFINALAFPAHFQYLGIGKLKWLVINNSVTALIMLISAPLIGHFIGGVYIVMAWSVPTLIGPVILMMAYSLEYHVSTIKTLGKDMLILLVALALVICINYNLTGHGYFKNSPVTLFCLHLAVFAGVLAYPVFTNITIKKIATRIRRRYGK